MSADIGVFNAADLDDTALLIDGWYVGGFRGGVVVEATGPYENEEVALRKMVAQVWLYGDPKATTYVWDEEAGVFKPKQPSPILKALIAAGERL